MHRVSIPQIFENMEEATIGRWLLSEGATVAAGDPLCELITEKTTLDLTTEVGGTLQRIVAPEKAVVPPGFIVALVSPVGETLQEADVEAVGRENAALLARKGESATPDAAPVLQVPEMKPVVAPPTAGSRLRATPAARRAARELNVDLEAVAVAFPGKVLGEEDVKAFATSG